MKTSQPTGAVGWERAGNGTKLRDALSPLRR